MVKAGTFYILPSHPPDIICDIASDITRQHVMASAPRPVNITIEIVKGPNTIKELFDSIEGLRTSKEGE